MRRLILASHGSLAEGMLSAAEMIMGPCDDIAAYGLSKYKNPIDIYQHLKQEITKSANDEYLILCDINGGSVHSQLLHLCEYENVYIVTGMALSMVLEVKTASIDEPIKELINKIMTSAKDHVLLYSYENVQQQLNEGIEDDRLW